MAEILKGIDVTSSINSRTCSLVNELRSKGVIPTLCIIRVGEKPDDLTYENGAVKRASTVGVDVVKRVFPVDVSEEKLISTIQDINNDAGIHGVLIFRPLPKHINEARVCNALNPAKDMDGITDISMAGVYSQKPLGYPPCTAQAVLELLSHYGIELSGKNVTVIGRSLVIGKPVSMMLLKSNATVTICHTRTKHLSEVARKADIIVAAAGCARMVTKDFVRDEQVIVDVGINWDDAAGRIVGDVDFDSVSDIVSAITPVPGGVGGVTTSVLMSHVAEAARLMCKTEE